MRRAFLPLVAALLLAVPVACKKPPPPETETKIQYGEPVGVKMAGPAGTRPIEIAIAVTKGKDPAKQLEPLVGALFAAVNACPEFIEAAKGGHVGEIAFTLEGGTAKVPKVENPHPSHACLVKGIEGKKLLPEGSEKLDVLAQLRVAPETDGGKP
jgi:hypothetical protein